MNSKRERLREAANSLFLSKGYANTSLADIAKEAKVPLGNVYYYFKTKKEFLDEVISTDMGLDIALKQAEKEMRTENPLYIQHMSLAYEILLNKL